jgi:hypothetical protein
MNLQLLSVPALLLPVIARVGDQEVREEGRSRHGRLTYMVEASYLQYSIEGGVVACHCCSKAAYH